MDDRLLARRDRLRRRCQAGHQVDESNLPGALSTSTNRETHRIDIAFHKYGRNGSDHRRDRWR
jgi:hypothetical protein